LAIAFLLESR